MGDRTQLRALLEQVRKAKGPDPQLDWDIAAAFGIVVRRSYGAIQVVFWEDDSEPTGVWRFWMVTSSIDAAVALVHRILPGWCWKTGSCSVSDDAWIAPDRNGPAAHLLTDRLFDEGFDVDRRPPLGEPGCALALTEAMLMAFIALSERQPDRAAGGSEGGR